MTTTSSFANSGALPQTESAGQALPIEQHSLARTLCLHLFPGALVTLAYALAAPHMQQLGVPNLLTFNLLVMLILVPVESGILFAEGKKKTGKYSLQGVVLNRERIAWWQLVGLAVSVFFWLAVCFTLVQSILDPLVQKTLFGWVPNGFLLMANFSAYPRSTILLTLAVSLVCTSWVAPFVEEYYFRGYLLPRISRFGNRAPVLNATLFSLYHFFTPWQAITRLIAVTPMAWLVQRKRSLYIGILAHLAINTISLLPSLIRLLAQ